MVDCRGKQRPIIDRRTVNPISVSRGENVVIAVRFSGDPPPNRTWKRGKAALKQSHSVLIEDKDHVSRLTLLNAKRSDGGQYELNVENEFGQETALVDVAVRVEPSKPVSLLKNRWNLWLQNLCNVSVLFPGILHFVHLDVLAHSSVKELCEKVFLVLVF